MGNWPYQAYFFRKYESRHSSSNCVTGQRVGSGDGDLFTGCCLCAASGHKAEFMSCSPEVQRVLFRFPPSPAKRQPVSAPSN